MTMHCIGIAVGCSLLGSVKKKSLSRSFLLVLSMFSANSRGWLTTQTKEKNTPDWFIEANLLFVIQDQVSNLIRNVRSSRIFEPSFDANRSFESDFIPSTGMQKSCTASSIVDLGNVRNFIFAKRKWVEVEAY